MQLRRALHRAAAGGQLVRIASSSGTLVCVTIDTRTVTGGRSLRLPMTWEEWQALGETKHHEWWDGVCVVNPPNLGHTRVARRLLRLLDDHRPPGHEALAERGLRTPLGDFEPDVVLVPLEGPAGSYVFDPPLLVVEISSPTTRSDDWRDKRERYGRQGLPWYWIVEQDALTVMRSEGGELVELQRIVGGTPEETVGPVCIPVDPGTLGEP